MDRKHELLVENIKKLWKLRSIHLFDEGKDWRVFGFRQNATGFNASVAEGFGPSIAEALKDLADSLAIGPIRANEKKEKRLGLS